MMQYVPYIFSGLCIIGGIVGLVIAMKSLLRNYDDHTVIIKDKKQAKKEELKISIKLSKDELENLEPIDCFALFIARYIKKTQGRLRPNGNMLKSWISRDMSYLKDLYKENMDSEIDLPHERLLSNKLKRKVTEIFEKKAYLLTEKK